MNWSENYIEKKRDFAGKYSTTSENQESVVTQFVGFFQNASTKRIHGTN